jgi:outer membrane protein
MQQQEGIALDRERREFLQRRNQALNEKMVQRMKGILEEIRKLVEEQAKVDNYDYVFDKSGLSTSQVPSCSTPRMLPTSPPVSSRI